MQARQIAVAIQAAYTDDVELAAPLRLAEQVTLDGVAPAAAPVQRALSDASLSLRLASRLAQLSIQTEASEQAKQASPQNVNRMAPPKDDGSLRMSTQMGIGAAGNKVPRWRAGADPVPRLRAAGSLGLPGASGTGRASAIGSMPAPVPMPSDRLLEDDVAMAEAGAISVGGPGLPLGGGQAVGEAVDSGFAGTGWEVPPVRWGGSLGFSMQRGSSNSGSNQSSSSGQGLFANINASSYIYAPWFATVSGRLGVTSSSSSTSSSNGDAGTADTNKSANVVGGGELAMFSNSRFPFRAYFDRSDSRTSGSIVSNDYISTRFGLSQNYRAEDGVSNSTFMLDRSVVDSSDGNSDSVTAVSGNYATQTGIWQHSLNGRYSLGEREKTHESARLFGLNSSHSANLSDSVSLGATMNYSDSELRTANGNGGLFANRGRYLQMYSYGSWMPEFEDLDDLPLTLNGSLRYGNQENSFGTSQTSAQTLGINVSGMYRFSNNLTASVNTAVNRISVSESGSRLLSLVGSNVNYVGNPLVFGKFSYNWNVGGNANWQSGVAEVRANAVYGAIASHAVARSFTPTDGHTLSLSFSQSLNVMNNQAIGTSDTLSNSLSANYGLYFGERFSGSFSTTLSDVQTSGVNAQHYQSFSLGMVGQGALTQQSALNLNLMFNWTDQTNQTFDAFGLPQTMSNQRMTLNGSANYSHLRFWGVRGLRYNLLFAADTRLRDDRLYGNFNTDQDRSRLSLTNRLDYTIGLLNFRFSLVNNETGGKKNALLFFQVTRQIGAY